MSLTTKTGRQHQRCWKCWDLERDPRFVYAGPQDAPRMDEITECPKCHNQVLRETDVGKSCYACGTEIFARDGNWTSEYLRPKRTGD